MTTAAIAAETSFVEAAFERGFCDNTAAPLLRLLGTSMPAAGEEKRYAVTACGRFRGSSMDDLLTYARSKQSSGALIVTDGDAERVLYFSNGLVIGAASTVLFERLGRLLYNAELVTHDDSNVLVEAEENHGASALLLWLSSAHLAWAVERRVWEIGGGLALVKKGHFIFVEGEPELDCPLVSIEPEALAGEGARIQEQLRNGSTDSNEDEKPEVMRNPPPPVQRELKHMDLSQDTIGEILKRIREVETTAQR